MKTINKEIKKTIRLIMVSDIDSIALVLEDHLKNLLAYKLECIKEDGFISSVADEAKPLTIEELKAGGWWCSDVSEECRLEFVKKGIETRSPDWSIEVGHTHCCLPGSIIRRSTEQVFSSALKQIHRIGNEFYWSEK